MVLFERLAGAISTNHVQMRLEEIPNPPAGEESSLDEREAQSASKLSITEDRALALLERRDLRAEDIEKIFANAAAMKSRKVHLAMAGHPKRELADRK